jgi:hypothetical protein
MLRVLLLKALMLRVQVLKVLMANLMLMLKVLICDRTVLTVADNLKVGDRRETRTVPKTAGETGIGEGREIEKDHRPLVTETVKRTPTETAGGIHAEIGRRRTPLQSIAIHAIIRVPRKEIQEDVESGWKLVPVAIRRAVVVKLRVTTVVTPKDHAHDQRKRTTHKTTKTV